MALPEATPRAQASDVARSCWLNVCYQQSHLRRAVRPRQDLVNMNISASMKSCILLSNAIAVEQISVIKLFRGVEVEDEEDVDSDDEDSDDDRDYGGSDDSDEEEEEEDEEEEDEEPPPPRRRPCRGPGGRGGGKMSKRMRRRRGG